MRKHLAFSGLAGSSMVSHRQRGRQHSYSEQEFGRGILGVQVDMGDNVDQYIPYCEIRQPIIYSVSFIVYAPILRQQTATLALPN